MIENKSKHGDTVQFFIHLARAFGGAILFSFPLLMTMEMWFLGFYIDAWRLALFTLLTVPLLVGLSYYDGFEPTSYLTDDVVDTFVAYAVGFVTATAVMLVFGIIKPEMSAGEIIGKISIQAVMCSFGAMFAQSLLAGGDDADEREQSEERKREASYFGELFLMAVGAVFLSMSVAPTEEIELISYRMSHWHTFILAVATLLLMQAFVYAEFRGKEKTQAHAESFAKMFFRFTIVGYAIVLLISFYILWTFGTIDAMNFSEKIRVVVVLGFPAAIGASASRFIL